VLGGLQAGGVIVQTSNEPSGYVPGRDLETIGAKHLLDLVRLAGEDRFLSVAALPAPEPVEDMLRRIDSATEAALENMTAKDLAGARPDSPESLAPTGSRAV
jgi:hypothetical protein